VFKSHFLGTIVGFTAPKQPKNPKFTLNERPGPLPAKTLCISIRRRPKQKTAHQPQNARGSMLFALSSNVVYPELLE